MKYFGTDGIRGKFGQFPIIESFINRLAQAIKVEFSGLRKIVIGRDTRFSGETITQFLLSGIGSDTEVFDAKVVTSPVLSRLVGEVGADLGIMITASHNPAADNGIKIFDSKGEKLSVERELKLEATIDSIKEQKMDYLWPKSLIFPNFYANLRQNFNESVVVDLANGAAGEFAKSAYFFKNIVWVGDHPDGRNINENCGSEYPDLLGKKVILEHADLGIAHDGDGDRVIFCDRFGAVVPGEIILGIIAIYFKKTGKLTNNTIITTNMSNYGLETSLRDFGIKVKYVDVGDRNVTEAMKKLNCNVGGESSGHVILKDYLPTSDGIVTALTFLEALKFLDISLENVSRYIKLLPKRSCNIQVRCKVPLEEVPEIVDCVRSVEKDLCHQGKVFVRYSGTENKIRLLVEAPTEALAEKYVQKLKNEIENCKKIV